MNDLNKTSSADLKDEKKLLHFGLDYLTLNLIKEKDSISETEEFLRSIFLLPHDTDNTNVFYDFKWDQFEHPLTIYFSDTHEGQVAGFNLNNLYLFQVCEIDWEKPVWANTNYRYRYRLQFYGALFNEARKGDLEYMSLFTKFLNDVERRLISHSISRSDICADFSGFTPLQIKKGVKGTRRKKMNSLEEDPDTGQIETFYYGNKKKDRNTWLVRAYDKLADSRAKHKEKLYSDYFQYKSVTRLEFEIHSDTIRLFGLDLKQALNSKCQWGVLEGLMKTKYNYWEILKFLKRERVIYDFESVFMEKKIKKSIPLSREEFAKRFLSKAYKFEDKYGEDPAVYLMKNDIQFRKNVYNYLVNHPQVL